LEEYGERDHLTIALTNDLAYYFAISDDITRIKQSINMMDSLFEIIKTLDIADKGAFYDTMGYAKMRLYALSKKKDIHLLYDAFRFIKDGLSQDRGNESRQVHMEECIELLANSSLI